MNEIELETQGQRRVYFASDGSITIKAPMKFTRRSGRAMIKSPNGDVIGAPWDKEPTILQLALARGHRWVEMFESGEVGSLKEIAVKEGVDPSYISRMTNLVSLAPEVVLAILNDEIPPELTLFDLSVGTPLSWDEQHSKFGVESC